MKGFVYILRDNESTFYIGSTNDLERRLQQHKNGYNYTTRRMIDAKLVFSQEYPTLTIARGIEVKLKKLKRKDYIKKIVLDGYIKIK